MELYLQYVLNGTVREKKYLFSLKRFSEKFFIQCDFKCTFLFLQLTLYPRQILIKIEFSRNIFEIYSDVKFHDNPSSWVHIIPCRQWNDGRK